MNKQEAIELVANALQLKFSEEQKTILNNDRNIPLLVNACAGSGKTTLFLISIIVRAIANEQRPNEVLGITFSKKAQLEMQDRYRNYIDKLPQSASLVNFLKYRAPTFVTFHALFYRLLKTIPKYSNIRVLSTWRKYYFDLSKDLDLSRTELPPDEYLESIFNTYEYVINNTLSWDGLYPNSTNKLVNSLLTKDKLSMEPILKYVVGSGYDASFYKNYLKVIHKYSNLKKASGLIDFNDMKLKLMTELTNADVNALLKAQVSQYKQIYIDEFQDIDPLQWILLKKLFNEDTFNHLFVIGDDDQSIYSFRGSSPYYITEFATKLMPSAQVLNLSTNYRTGGHILNIAKPIIEKNEARLTKKLLAFNKNKGKIFLEDESKKDYDDNFFKDLVKYAADSSTDTAVLVRFNRDKTVLADRLASKGYFTNVNKKGFILQNTGIYETFIELMDSLINNDAQKYIKYSNKIGFRKYKQFLEWESRFYGEESLDDLLNILLEIALSRYDATDYKHKKNRDLGSIIRYIEDTLDILAYIKKIRSSKESQDEELLSRLFEKVTLLTMDFFEYMYKNNYYNQNNAEKLINYMEVLFSKTNNWKEFRKSEDLKCIKMEQIIDKNLQMPNLQLLTMHQAKGLEFNNVFIYGLTDDVLDSEMILINRLFPSNINFNEFIRILRHMPNKQFNNLFLLLSDCLIDQANKIMMKYFDLSDYSKLESSKNKLKRQSNKKNDGFKKMVMSLDQDNLKLLFYEVLNLSAHVEEERRLLYVAMTRAENNLYIDIPKEGASPLLKEVKKAVLHTGKKIKAGK